MGHLDGGKMTASGATVFAWAWCECRRGCGRAASTSSLRWNVVTLECNAGHGCFHKFGVIEAGQDTVTVLSSADHRAVMSSVKAGIDWSRTGRVRERIACLSTA